MKPSAAQTAIFDSIRMSRSSEPNRLIALGANIFAGGFSFGVEEAGFKVAGHMELTDLTLGSETSAQRWPVLVAPLDDRYEYQGIDPTITWENTVAKLKSSGLKVDLVYANPPCVAYAKQGARRDLSDERMCYVQYCAHTLAMGLEPDMWMWELVDGIYDQDVHYLEKMAFDAGKQGYKCWAFLTSSALHGGFQNRIRFHFMASKFELDFDGVYANEPPERKGYRTLGDALAIVESARANGVVLTNDEIMTSERNNLLKIIPFCPPGGYLRDVPDEVMRQHYKPRGREWNGEGRAGVTQVRGRRDRTCPVIVGGHTVIHPDEDRFLTVRENATVMGFPLNYKFSRNTAGYQEVGRGLCTHNAAFISRVAMDALTRRIPVSLLDLKTLHRVDWRGRATVPSMASTMAERQAWWAKKHPDLPIELAAPRPKGKPGRPKGSVTRQKIGSKPVATVVYGSDASLQEDFDTLKSNLAGFGVEVRAMGIAELDAWAMKISEPVLVEDGSEVDDEDASSEEAEVEPELNDLGSRLLQLIKDSDVVVVSGVSTDVRWASLVIGMATALDAEVFVVNSSHSEYWNKFGTVLQGDVTKTATDIAKTLGLERSALEKRAMETVASLSNEELLQLIELRNKMKSSA